MTTDLQRLAAHEWSGNLGSEYIWVPKLSHYTSCRKRRGKRREKNRRGKGGVKGWTGQRKGKRGWTFVSFGTQCKKKDKEKGQRFLG